MATDDKAGWAARAGAVTLLGAVIAENRMLSEAVLRLSHLAPPDRARAQTLAATVLRTIGPIDRVLDRHLEQRPPLRVLNALRVCAAEILVDGIKAYGPVNAAVALIKRDRKHGRLAGLVNAVARKLERETLEGLAPQPLPKAIRGAVAGAFGEATAEAIEKAHALRPPVDLTVKADAPGWAERLGGRLLPGGSVRLAAGSQISALEGYDSGEWWVQDAAAALPVRLLGDVAGARVLDLCAAPGGKTLQLAAAGAQVTALDLSQARLERLRENLTRTRLSAEVIAADALTWEPDAPFDAILLDAPCSATGTIRRHPDLPFVRPSLDLKPLLELQAALLARAAGWLRPGGRLVYAVCSLIPAEGERQVARALQGGLWQPAGRGAAGLGLPEWQAGASGLRTRPDHWPEWGGMDGFFMAALAPADRS